MTSDQPKDTLFESMVDVIVERINSTNSTQLGEDFCEIVDRRVKEKLESESPLEIADLFGAVLHLLAHADDSLGAGVGRKDVLEQFERFLGVVRKYLHYEMTDSEKAVEQEIVATP